MTRPTAADVTIVELSAKVLGMNVPWPTVLSLAYEAERVMACFQSRRGTQVLGQALEIPKQSLIRRAEWAAHCFPDERICVFAVGKLLYFGGTP